MAQDGTNVWTFQLDDLAQKKQACKVPAETLGRHVYIACFLLHLSVFLSFARRVPCQHVRRRVRIALEPPSLSERKYTHPLNPALSKCLSENVSLRVRGPRTHSHLGILDRLCHSLNFRDAVLLFVRPLQRSDETGHQRRARVIARISVPRVLSSHKLCVCERERD